jgi:hypothetical protein
VDSPCPTPARAAVCLTRYAAAAALLAAALQGAATADPHKHSWHKAPGFRPAAGPHGHSHHQARHLMHAVRPAAPFWRSGPHMHVRPNVSRFRPGFRSAAPGWWYGSGYDGVDPAVNPLERLHGGRRQRYRRQRRA